MGKGPPFRRGDPRAREAGRKGGLVGSAARRTSAPEPYAGTVIDLMDLVGLSGPDWFAWRVVLKACFCLELTSDELTTFQKLTGLETPPTTPVLELWLCCGRRAGKSTIAAALSLFMGIRAQPRTFAKADELIVIPVIAADRKQARVLLGHLRSFTRAPELRRYVKRADLKDTIELANGITIEIQTSSSRSTRGYTAVAIVADEVAHWPTEGADPADEILAALTPTMGTVPDPLLLALSNPHEPRGPLFDNVTKYYGQPNDEGVLVVVADTLSLHPSFSRAVIKRAFARDAVKAASEYGDPDTSKILFRQGSSALFDQAPVDAAIVAGRRELPPVDGRRCHAFLDASQGARSGDSMTLAIAHEDNGRAVLDCVVERRPPFSPMEVLVKDFAPVLERYRVTAVVGDNVSRGFVEATLRSLGVRFDVSTQDKSALYLHLLSLINSAGVELLDDPTLRLQLLSLQRYPTSGGKDRVDHPRGRPYHDDVANSVAGAIGLATGIAGNKKKYRAIVDGPSAYSESQDQNAVMLAAIRMKHAELDARDERDFQLSRLYEDLPMLSNPVWFLHSNK